MSMINTLSLQWLLDSHAFPLKQDRFKVKKKNKKPLALPCFTKIRNKMLWLLFIFALENDFDNAKLKLYFTETIIIAIY